MKVFKNINTFKKWRNSKSNKIGFVPTMGAIHDGHLSLIKKSKKICDITIVSIFVNPLQFNKKADFINYPKSIKQDINLLKLNKVDALFLPSNQMMYKKNSTFINESKISIRLEGAYRPGHFKGVLTIVSKLFNITKPTDAFFGKKDAQQLRVIKKMVKDLNYDINIVSCPIIREKSGLAMSSRNNNLKEKDREKASIIYKGLQHIKIELNNGEKSISKLKKKLESIICSIPNIKIEYISIADDRTLDEIKKLNEENILISVAVKLQTVRLIDNFSYSFN